MVVTARFIERSDLQSQGGGDWVNMVGWHLAVGEIQDRAVCDTEEHCSSSTLLIRAVKGATQLLLPRQCQPPGQRQQV
jgi:hypothetical protein